MSFLDDEPIEKKCRFGFTNRLSSSRSLVQESSRNWTNCPSSFKRQLSVTQATALPISRALSCCNCHCGILLSLESFLFILREGRGPRFTLKAKLEYSSVRCSKIYGSSVFYDQVTWNQPGVPVTNSEDSCVRTHQSHRHQTYIYAAMLSRP